MTPKAHQCKMIANEESMSLAWTCPSTPEEDPSPRSSRSSSPSGSKRRRDDDTVCQDDNDLELVSRKLQRTFLSDENDMMSFGFETDEEEVEDEGTDFAWMYSDFCVCA